MSCVVLTDHARSRYKSRTSVSKSRMEKDAQKALENGVRFDETSGGLRRYIDALHWTNPKVNNIRIYCGRVYIFSGSVLITVFDLPEKYRRKETEMRIRKRREMEG